MPIDVYIKRELCLTEMINTWWYLIRNNSGRNCMSLTYL